MHGPWWPAGSLRPGARARLFCLPFAGGGASLFHAWRGRARAGLDVVPLLLPGREGRIREAAFRGIDPLLDALGPALAPLLSPPGAGDSAVPYALFGHSMGALVAFELAHRLVRSGAPAPAHLFVSGARAPQLPPTGDPPLHLLADAAFEAALREFNGTPEAVLADRELMELLLPTLRADFELCETYRCAQSEPLPCPITAFGGERDRQVDIEALQAWRACAGAGFAATVLPGDHFFVLAQGARVQAQIEEQLLPSSSGPGVARA